MCHPASTDERKIKGIGFKVVPTLSLGIQRNTWKNVLFSAQLTLPFSPSTFNHLATVLIISLSSKWQKVKRFSLFSMIIN